MFDKISQLKLVDKKTEKDTFIITILDEKSLKNKENLLAKKYLETRLHLKEEQESIFEIVDEKNLTNNHFYLFSKDKDLQSIRVNGGKISCLLKKYNPQNILIENQSYFSTFELMRGLFDKYYSFDKYKTEKKSVEKLLKLKNINLSCADLDDILLKELINETKAIYLTRDLVNEPANEIYAESFAKIGQELLKKNRNIKIKIFKEKELKKLGANMMLGVNQGSAREPVLMIVEYKGDSDSKDWDFALVGKGVTFDSGGLSIKPAAGMEDMKGDMAGAATVLSTIFNASENKIKSNIVCFCGLVENMTGSNAQRPGDIVKSMSGLTVEILNTDAEGRLVLGDVLYYAKKTYNPKMIIDLATLTGAIAVSLGLERAGLFSNNKKLTEKILKAGEETLNFCWHMPLDQHHKDAVKSKIADIRNTSTIKGGGSCTAAAFLENFIDDHKEWAHIDIANVSNYDGENKLYGSGASGFGIRLLMNLIRKSL